ncbi:MAG TPA: hypothetical protein EYH24_00355 [Thermococcus paralvinellae]|uniref:Uncharacterized protein n=1 Tax=Thermococcus paralvinellae TaxID=582419 RepID=A0A833E1D1_9EURY|nr:hypothetical protein [Thermococcus paralvinellae]HIP88447.1 hypothetical protein [Thermococcus paralvinellae]
MEYIIQKIGGSKYMAILSDPKSLSYAGADPWNGDHDHTLVKQVAYDSLSVALDLLNSYVATAKDIGQLMYDLARGVSSTSHSDTTYWDVRWDFCSFFGGGPTETHTYFKFEVEVPKSDPLFEIKLISKVNDNPDSTVMWDIMGDYPDYPRPIGIASIPKYPVSLTTSRLSQKGMLPEGIDWVKVQVPTKYHGKVIIEKMSYKGQSVELYVITPEGLAKYGKLLGIPNDLIEHFTKMDKPLYLIKNPNNVQVKVG